MTLKPNISSMFVSKADDNDISPKIVIEVPKDAATVDIYIHAVVLMRNTHTYSLQLFNGSDPKTCIYEIDLKNENVLQINDSFSTIDIAAISTIQGFSSENSFEYIYSLLEDGVKIDTNNTFIYFKEMDV